MTDKQRESRPWEDDSGFTSRLFQHRDESEITISTRTWKVYEPKYEAVRIRYASIMETSRLDGLVEMIYWISHLAKWTWYRPDGEEMRLVHEMIGRLDRDEFKVFEEEDKVIIRKMSGGWVENDLL